MIFSNSCLDLIALLVLVSFAAAVVCALAAAFGTSRDVVDLEFFQPSFFRVEKE